MDAIARLVRIPLADRSPAEVMEDVTRVVAEVVTGADSTSITLVQDGRAFTPAATSALAVKADEVQYASGAGPCLQAARTGGTVVVRDTRRERRWQLYADQALRHGVRSSVSVALPLPEGSLGALNIYATRPESFDAAAAEAAETVAGFAAVVVANADAYAKARDLADRMKEAMRSRADIEMAKGIIMAQRRCTPDHAVAVLLERAEERGQKVREAAHDLVAAIRR